MESQSFEFLLLGQRGQRGKLPAHIERRAGITPQQRVEAGARKIGVVIEANHVLRQRRESHLRLQNVLLRYFSDSILDARRFNSLTRDAFMLIMNPQFVAGAQQIIEGLMDPHPYLQPDLVKLSLRHIHIGVRHARPQRPFAPSRQCLADAEHILSGVIIPRLLQRNSPSAIHHGRIVKRTGDGDVRLGDNNSPDSDLNLRIHGKRDPFNIVQRQRRGGSPRMRVLLKQGGKVRQDITLCGRLRAGNTGRHSSHQNAKCGNRNSHNFLQRKFGSVPGRAFTTRMSARRQTKASIQPAKEGVLESEYGATARRKLWRLFQSILEPRNRSGGQLQTGLMRHKGQFL